MLKLRGLEYSYTAGPRIAFADLDVPQGSVALVQGPSGSGKSTLLALVAGLLTACAGELWVAGQQPSAMPARQRDAWRAGTLGFMPQRLHLSAALSVLGNLELAYLAIGQRPDGQRIQALLEQLGLYGLQGRLPHELSLGQAQRVALARALVRRPLVVVADEPTANLDDEACTAALALLVEHAREAGATLVIATHDHRLASRLPDSHGLRCTRLEPQPALAGKGSEA